MTLAELREACKREARIKSTTVMDSFVNELIQEVLTDYTNLARYDDLRLEGVAITLVAGQQTYALPNDFQNLDTVRYGIGPVSTNNPGVYREVVAQPSRNFQTYQRGRPKYYRKMLGKRISFWPFGDILANDSLLIDYYVTPASVFSEDSDEFPVPSLEAAVKKDVIARLQRVYGDSNAAQVTGVDSRNSYIASRGSSQ